MDLIKKQINSIPEVYTSATFDEIKNDWINWLRGQDEFKDYDFKGSRLNVLLDLLSYNVLYIQQFSNSALYESFIRTASLRSSVVQAAQDMGYFPSSMTAAECSIMLECTHKLKPQSIKIPRGTKFLASSKDGPTQPYNFVVKEDVNVVKSKDDKYYPIINLVQGRVVRTELEYDPNQQILIRDKFMDRHTVRVMVNGVKWEDWTEKSIVNISGTSHVFYMRETIDEYTEIFFGEGKADYSIVDGSLQSNYIGGLKPVAGSNIVIEYIRTDGGKANGSINFSYADTLQYVSVVNIIENYDETEDYIGAFGGGDPEDIERIRELGPIKRESQRRCVTATDYESFVSERFGPIVQAVQCFTDRDKPGYAFIAIKPKEGLRLSSVQREDIQNYLKEYNISTITPSIMSPNYMFLRHKVKVTYSMNKLSESEQWLKGKIIDQIDKYYKDEVEIFNKSFHKSKMLTYVDDADISILGSSAEITMVRELENFFKTPMSGVKYNNKIMPRGLLSNVFEYTVNDELSYGVRLASTEPKGDLKEAKIVIGPFRQGDIKINPYLGTDFEKLKTTDNRNSYFVVGKIIHEEDYIYWDLGQLNVTSDKFLVPSIELYGTPGDSNIFTKDGSLIVFENNLRPEYTEIIMEPIA
ncbi:baseplate wedge subunit [Proteus phage phiP4-3]|uniref:Baseplate wedge protein gp6 n=1 Tax=Proteus phage phiP4-3 TaxID=2065203 RepID=A0A2I6PFI0_9CAUD|nr:baseplate wedge subunit [Proteus phage phiP4-3]AUM58480.1 baseplate wedge subunit [Proteus phage phiP4-3]